MNAHSDFYSVGTRGEVRCAHHSEERLERIDELASKQGIRDEFTP